MVRHRRTTVVLYKVDGPDNGMTPKVFDFFYDSYNN